MRAMIKSCLLVASAGLLIVSWHVGIAASDKEELNNVPLQQCKTQCLSIKDPAAYESCMIDCEKLYNQPSSYLPKKQN